MSSLELGQEIAKLIFDSFAAYNDEFRTITQTTRRCFEQRDWHAMRDAAKDRIELYDRSIGQALAAIEDRLGDRLHEEKIWEHCRSHYRALLDDRIDRELNKTYYNSISRRVFKTVGVNRKIEFVEVEAGPIDHIRERVSITRYGFDSSVGVACRRILEDHALEAPWRDIGDCAAYIHGELRRQLAAHGGTGAIEAAELVEPLFFRSTRAFIVGRLVLTEGSVPFLVALVHSPDGIEVDRVLTSTLVTSALFSYSRSYFHVDVETVGDVVAFLREILPRKPIEELYATLGRAKQAKTERYRAIQRHMARCDEPFIVAPGSKGMVMAVFTLPSLDVVFKVIRDQFAPPKTVTHEEVREKYTHVYMHDRAGRLIDAQEFRELSFRRNRFTEPVLRELLEECGDRVSADGDDIVIHHLYIERQLIPLNLYVGDADEAELERVIIDYGQAIRDLAATNIFPGDLLLKNFGVSSQGRVIFYDYDELCPVTDCKFRKMPRPRNEIEELSGEIWFEVGPDDIFPEQFVSFLGLQGDALELFKRHHDEVLTARFWREIQSSLRDGKVFDIKPYQGGRTGF
ncbi:MAG: bifunctional isocitrate dehydrogenase kinase/phosphatase [Pseudomonadota bacterium]